MHVDEPDLFSEAEEGVTDFDERHNPRFAEDVAMNADGIGKLNLFNFKVDKKTGKQTSVQYENDIGQDSSRHILSLINSVLFSVVPLSHNCGTKITLISINKAKSYQHLQRLKSVSVNDLAIDVFGCFLGFYFPMHYLVIGS